MFVFSNLLQALATILDTLLWLYFWLIIVSAILSWVSPDPFNPIVRVIRSLTEPVFQKVRSWIPFTNLGGIDLSPIVVLLGIEFLRIFLVQTLRQLSMQV
jgi:YggT family protein